MNILYDLISPQPFVGGAGEYVRKVFYTLLDTIKASNINVNLFGIYNSDINNFSYPDLVPETISRLGVTPVNIASSSLKEVIARYEIDKVFIGCAQYWGASLDVTNIQVPCVCVVHDLCEEDYEDSHVPELLKLPWGWYEFNRKRAGWHMRRILGQWKDPLFQMKSIMDMAKLNNNVQFVVVSEYTKASLAYHFDYPTDSIKVLYSCPRLTMKKDEIEDATLKEIVTTAKKYYLFLSANRVFKNPTHTFKAFSRFVDCHNSDAYLVTTGCKEKKFENHIPLGYLNENDLAQVMHHCYALLFPTFMEGFGYPPIEAMGYGKPVLCSNVTSVPEICGDAAIYFSPIYESDIFRALSVLTSSNYEEYVAKSKARYQQVCGKQSADLKELIKMILDK